MGLFRRKPEIRADTGTVQFDDALLKALLGNETVTKEKALQVPTVSGGIDLIANIVASTPVRLYRENNGRAEEVKDDEMVLLARELSKKIEDEMEYPGQIKVHLVRETRVVDYAK